MHEQIKHLLLSQIVNLYEVTLYEFMLNKCVLFAHVNAVLDLDIASGIDW